MGGGDEREAMATCGAGSLRKRCQRGQLETRRVTCQREVCSHHVSQLAKAPSRPATAPLPLSPIHPPHPLVRQ
jgi:hypothetical protein